MTTTAADLTRAAWEQVAARYDDYVTPTHLEIAQRGLQQIGVRPGMRLLDVAAGSGAVAITAARLGADVLAVDLSPTMLARLRARADAEGLAVQTRVMDGHALDVTNDTFDVVTSQYGVMLFTDPYKGIAEMVRVSSRSVPTERPSTTRSSPTRTVASRTFS